MMNAASRPYGSGIGRLDGREAPVFPVPVFQFDWDFLGPTVRLPRLERVQIERFKVPADGPVEISGLETIATLADCLEVQYWNGDVRANAGYNDPRVPFDCIGDDPIHLRKPPITDLPRLSCLSAESTVKAQGIREGAERSLADQGSARAGGKLGFRGTRANQVDRFTLGSPKGWNAGEVGERGGHSRNHP